MGSRKKDAVAPVPPETAWLWGRRPIPHPDLRVSTQERTEVADALSQHYAEGRLDATEFNERLEQAMAAKTRADLSGLLTDLPLPGGAPTPNRRRTRHVLPGALVLIGLLFLVGAAAPSVWHLSRLLVVCVVVWLLWRAFSRRRAGGGRHPTPPEP